MKLHIMLTRYRQRITCGIGGHRRAVHGCAANTQLRGSGPGDGWHHMLEPGGQTQETGRGCSIRLSGRPGEAESGSTTLQGAVVRLAPFPPFLGAGGLMETSMGDLCCQQKLCQAIQGEGGAPGSRSLEALELHVTFRLGVWDH